MTDISDHLKGILNTLPGKPGVYLMKDKNAGIIYVGKAVNIRSRVRSYFQKSANHSRKTRRMLIDVADISWIIVDSELEALILEMNLIKKHKPHYNVRLKDDKRYPFIRVHWEDPFPKVTVTRIRVTKESRYFGPYTSVWAVHQTLDLLRKIFPYRTCDRVITGEDPRACLYFDIKLCTAPCIGRINNDEYRAMINDLCRFLEGHTDPILARLKSKMQSHSDSMNFEKAALIRDQILAIERVVERQKIISNQKMNSDIIALARDNGDSCVQVFFIRRGRLIGREYFILEGTEDENNSEILEHFITQFYSESTAIPQEIILPNEIEEAVIIQQWLNQQRRGKKVYIRIPQRGKGRELLRMASENAVDTLKALKMQWEVDAHRQSEALTQLQQNLGLTIPPNRIECYDISNIQGTAAIGSMVVFEKGVPNKKLYRQFNIKSVTGPDDFASMEEILSRRFKRWQSIRENNDVGNKIDPAFGILPDLLIVDGGKGQLSRAVKVMKSFDIADKFLAVGLAKEHELIFVPDRDTPIELPGNSQALFMMQRIRDEAHRFAITAHRKKRIKSHLISKLDQIPRIGPSRKKALLIQFGSLEGVKRARPEELQRVKGIDEKLANTIFEFLNH